MNLGLVTEDPLLLALLIGVVGLLSVALALVGTAYRLRVRNNRTQREWERREVLWDPALLGVLAGTAPDQALHALVAAADRFFFIDYLLRYARRLDGDERATIERIAAPYLAPLAASFTKRDDEFRARAVRTLGLLGQRDYRELIVGALDDPSDLVAMAAARSLTQSGSPELATAVLDRLPRFHRWRPSLLASMLARVGPDMAPPLRAAFQNPDGDPAARAVAVEALTELNDLEAADPAAALLAGTTDRNLVVALLGLLLATGRTEHLSAIRPLLDAPEAPVRARAFAAVARLDRAFSAADIQRVLADESPWVPIRVVEALEAVGATRLVAQINAAHRLL